jgi:hypothetical protein
MFAMPKNKTRRSGRTPRQSGRPGRLTLQRASRLCRDAHCSVFRHGMLRTIFVQCHSTMRGSSCMPKRVKPVPCRRRSSTTSCSCLLLALNDGEPRLRPDQTLKTKSFMPPICGFHFSGLGLGVPSSFPQMYPDALVRMFHCTARSRVSNGPARIFSDAECLGWGCVGSMICHLVLAA